jgi:hypothetical protein
MASKTVYRLQELGSTVLLGHTSFAIFIQHAHVLARAGSLVLPAEARHFSSQPSALRRLPSQLRSRPLSLRATVSKTKKEAAHARNALHIWQSGDDEHFGRLRSL